MLRKKIKLINFSIIMLLLSGMSGCTTKFYKDVSSLTHSQTLPVPKGEFESVTWFEENHIAFVYRPEELVSNNRNEDFRVGIFELSSNTFKDLTFPHLILDCYGKDGRISNLSQLPNGSLGFIFHCAPSGDGLYVLNLESDEIVKQQTYLGFTAQSFSFSPDMSRIVQENGNGGGLSEELLLVSADGTMNRLLPDFQRARSPAWSLDGKTMAFAGTRDNPNDSEITTLQDIESLFLYPWDIYVMDADGSNPRIILPLAGTIYGLKWSPTNENLLLFGGDSFDNVPGVWLLDIADGSVKRIWNQNSNFDWSPDGSKIVLLDDATEVWWTSIKIIDIGNLLSNKP